MTDKITKALETVNELHGETLRKMDDDPYSFAAFLNFHYAAYQEQLKYIDNLRAEVAKYKAIASKAVREQIDVRKDERERCVSVRNGLIAELRAENEKLRAALKDAASWLQDAYFDTASEEYKEAELAALAAALKETGDEQASI